MSIMASGRHLSLVAMLVLMLLCISAIIQIGTTSAQGANPTRDLPDVPVQRGETFDVTIIFIAPDDDFNAIGLTDNVPTGWDIQVDTSWCTPNADQTNVVGNQPQYVWYGPYSSGESFTILYKVTVPVDAEFDTYLFDGQLGYKIASGARIFKDISGDSGTNVIVADPSPTTPTPSPTPTPALTPTPPGTWSFGYGGCFPKHLPDDFNGSVILAGLPDVPSAVQGVYWYDGDEWLFWAPGAPGCTLSTLGGGHTYDYLICVTLSCEWEIPLSVSIPTPTPVPTPTPLPTISMSCVEARNAIQDALDGYNAQYQKWPTVGGEPGDIEWIKLVPEFMTGIPANDSDCVWWVNSDPEGDVCVRHQC